MNAARERRKRAQIVMEVVATQRISEDFQRITLGGEGFASFENNPSTDKYIKLLLPPVSDSGLQPPFDLDALRAKLPKEQLPVRRTYTVRSVDEDRGELVVDFVIHGAEGVAGPWATNAKVGDKVQFGGPGGKFSPDSEADWYLFVGDEAAIPAIAAALESMDDDAVGVAHIEVADKASEWDLAHPAGVELHWHHRGGDVTADSDTLEAAVRETHWRAGSVQIFCHGEREVMKRLRAYFMEERGVERADLSLSAYWAYGRAEDQFQAEKKTPVGQIYTDSQLQY